ncbi:MAG TPA: hypothetical protein VLD62_03465 [Acidimicrobiia bacterium]|nr:hypothetical protein [Acidimicrobiia bacterium]
MMRRALATLLLLLLWAAPAGAQEDVVAVADLLADPASFAAPAVSSITVVGELVGDYGGRDGHVWTQINDDAYAAAPLLAGGSLAGGNVGIGVRIPDGLFSIARSDTPGGYRHRGPIVRITGAWRHHDPDRGGESYLDAETMELVAHEQPLDEGLRPIPLIVGVVLGAGGVALWIDDRRRARFR